MYAHIEAHKFKYPPKFIFLGSPLNVMSTNIDDYTVFITTGLFYALIFVWILFTYMQ